MNPGILTPPTQFATMPRGLLGNPQPTPMPDAKLGRDFDAQRYIDGVERADGQILEDAVRSAINDFVVGCKIDRTWPAIRASCILMGARTLAGALVPLVGTAPTNFNFVSGDYNRRTGLASNGSTKYLDSNRRNNADAQNDNHNAIWISTAGTPGASSYMGAGLNLAGSNNILLAGSVSVGLGNSVAIRSRASSLFGVVADSYTGFIGHSRQDSAGVFCQASQTTTRFINDSATPTTDSVFVFARNNGSGAANTITSGRLAFYSLGPFINLAALESRVSTLITSLRAFL